MQILPLKIWTSVNGQPSVAFAQIVGKALSYLVDLIKAYPSFNIVALNLSVHAYSLASYEQYEEPQIQELANLGIFIAAASGNEGMTEAIDYPAADPNVYAIGGVYGAGPDVDQVTARRPIVHPRSPCSPPSIDTPIIDDGNPGA